MTLLEVLSPVSPQRTPHSMSLPHCPSTPKAYQQELETRGWRERGGIGGPASDAGWGSRKEGLGYEPGSSEAVRPRSWAG